MRLDVYVPKWMVKYLHEWQEYTEQQASQAMWVSEVPSPKSDSGSGVKSERGSEPGDGVTSSFVLTLLRRDLILADGIISFLVCQQVPQAFEVGQTRKLTNTRPLLRVRFIPYIVQRQRFPL